MISGILLATMVAAAVFISPSNHVLANAPGTVSQQQLQEDLLKYKYPYSELPAGERVQLLQYEIDILNEQIIHFEPGQATTMSYIQNTLTHMQGLLSALTRGTLAPANVTGRHGSPSPVPVAIDMPYYGSNSGGADLTILNARPEFLVNNSAAGPWQGDANVSEYMSAGIKYFEYLDGGYEGSFQKSIPNDLQSNLNYVSAAADAGAYGIFLDEVSDGIYTTPDYDYLKAIATRAHSLGLKVVFCTGMPDWADRLMDYCDYLTSSEQWQNTPLTASQSKWATRVWLMTYGTNDATTAANLTEAAWSKGILAEYACYDYLTLPVWFDSYISQIYEISVSASKLAFTTQPSTNNTAAAAFGTQPVVTIEAAGGNEVPTSSASVTLSITARTGTTGAALSGATTVNAVNGVATFTGLSIDKTGSGYTLTATSDGLDSTTSDAFDVVAPAQVQGVTFEVKGVALGGVTLTVDGGSFVVSDAGGNYSLYISTPGSYSIVASKDGFRSVTLTMDVTDRSGAYTLNFKGDAGLIPDAATMQYALTCINKWKFAPADDTGMSMARALSVINAWKFPIQ